MAIELPRRETGMLLQNNRSNILGDIDSSFNLDLATNEGAIRGTRMKTVTTDSDEANLEHVGQFVRFNSKFYAMSEDIFVGGDFPSDAFVEDVSSNNPSVGQTTSDMATFNEALYVATPGASTLTVHKLTTGGTWSTADTTSITSKEPALVEPFDDKLYITINNTQVIHITTGDVLTASGTATLDLGLEAGWTITMLVAGNDRLWIGLLNSQGKGGLVYEWDGASENTTSRSYKIEEGVVSGIVKDNVPYIVTTNGKFMQFTGSSFKEVARLPIANFPLEDSISESNIRWIHPNGMAVVEDNIQMLISNEVEGSTPIQNPTIPSGIWEYSTKSGLTHKYQCQHLQ